MSKKRFGGGRLDHWLKYFNLSKKAFFFLIILTFSPFFRLQEIIGQKKVDDMEKKDEPPKDSRQQALIDQRYFQVLNS